MILISISSRTSLWYSKRLPLLPNYIKQLCPFQIHEIFMLQRTLVKQYCCLKLVHFSKKSGRLSLVGPEILTFGSHYSVNFHPILDYFLSNFKLKYEYSENIKANHVNTAIFNLHQIKHHAFFLGHLVL